MMKHDYSKKKYLNRKELLDAVDKKSSISEDQLSPFSQRAMKGMSSFEDSKELESFLNKLDSKIDQRVTAMSDTTEPEKTGSSFRILRIAAAVALLVVAAYFVFTGNNSEKDLFAANFEHLPSAVAGTNIERGDQELETLKDQAFYAYEQENYEQAIPKFEQYIVESPEDLESQFYFGIALLAEGRTTSAIDYLEKVRQTPPNTIYKEYATWYLALAYVQNNQAAAAKTLLTELTENAQDYKEAAEQLLHEL